MREENSRLREKIDKFELIAHSPALPANNREIELSSNLASLFKRAVCEKKNEVEENLKNNSKKHTLNEDNSKGINILDNGILDNEIINDEVSIDDAVDNELEENISDDDINLIDGENDIVLDVEIDEDDK